MFNFFRPPLTAFLNNLTIVANDSSADNEGITSAMGTRLNVSGHLQLSMLNSDSATGIAVFDKGLVNSNTAALSLNSANVEMSGNAVIGIAALAGGSINATGKVDVAANGANSAGLMARDGGHLSLNGGGVVAATGDKAVALATISSATLEENYVPQNFIPLPNQVNLTNYQLSSANGDVIRAVGGTSTINLNKTQASASAGQRLLWVNNGSDLPFTFSTNPAHLTLNADASTLTGDAVVAADGSVADINLNNSSVYTGAMSNVTNATIDASSVWNMPASSSLSSHLTNAGAVHFQNLGSTLTIGGHYNGTAGSVISLNTQLGGDNSPTDKVHVVGDTTGTTRLDVRNVGGTGAQTVNGINVVQVDGSSGANSFTMAAPVQAGSYEYTLKQGSAQDSNDWYLTSKYAPTVITPDPTAPNNPTVIDIYRPAIAAYVTAQSANADAGFTQLSTLHQRVSDQRQSSTDQAQTWGRLLGAEQSNKGHERFEYNQFTTGFQFGQDLLHKGQNRAGITLNYAYSKTDAADRARSLVDLSQDTGTIGSTAVGLGGYYTNIAQNGRYIDVVGQANYLTNKFNDNYGGKSTQHGWQTGISAEIGQPVANVKGWSIEPQAQLSYLYTHYNDFSDAYSHIKMPNTHNLRARLGLRVLKDTVIDGQGVQYYGILNVGHDLIGTQSVTFNDRIGSGYSTVQEKFDRSYTELGAGIQGYVSKKVSLYADTRYQSSFKGERNAAQLNVGARIKF